MTGLLIAAPALPLHSAGKYVAAAYIVFVLLILIYVAIMARRLSRTERELAQLRSEIGARDSLQAQELAEPTARDREPDDGREAQPVR